MVSFLLLRLAGPGMGVKWVQPAFGSSPRLTNELLSAKELQALSKVGKWGWWSVSKTNQAFTENLLRALDSSGTNLKWTCTLPLWDAWAYVGDGLQWNNLTNTSGELRNGRKVQASWDNRVLEISLEGVSLFLGHGGLVLLTNLPCSTFSTWLLEHVCCRLS